nr:hypothetical protein [uncultured Treponema sp.]
MYDFLYNEEYWRKLMLRDERKKAREEGLTEGRAEGLVEGARNKSLEVVKTGISMNLSAEQISRLSGLPLEEVESMMSL